MRRSMTGALAALLLAPLVKADDKERPIPQNAEQQEKRTREVLAWHQRLLVGAYDRFGKKDPRWDKPAREALEAFARFNSKTPDPQTKLGEVYAPIKRAIDAGCDDPLILYLYARSSYRPNYPGPEELERRYAMAAAALDGSAYPPFDRARAWYEVGKSRLARKELTEEARKVASRAFDAALAMLSKTADGDARDLDADFGWFDLLDDVIKGYRRLDEDRQAAFDRVDAVLAKIPALKTTRLQLKGQFLIHYAWDARGAGVASTVTKEGWEKFEERLTDARKVLEEAWEAAKPGESRAAALMLWVEIGIGEDRDDMEKWFERAMKASGGNNIQACKAKLEWLAPKWHGSPEEVLAFGQQCRDTKNWRAGITLLIADAHLAVAEVLPPKERAAYYRAQSFYNDIYKVYEEYLQHYPFAYQERSTYAALCTLAGYYDTAHKQFEALGDNVWYSQRFPKEWMDEARASAAKVAAEAARQAKEPKVDHVGEALVILGKAERLEIYSLGPLAKQRTEERFRGRSVLGKIEITDAKTREEVVQAVLKDSKKVDAIGSERPAPRHGIRVTHDGKTVDFVICFESPYVYVYGPHDSIRRIVQTAGTAQKILDQILADAKVPLPKQEK
jgi:hypothetical protein